MRESMNITFNVQRSNGEEVEPDHKPLVRRVSLDKIFEQAAENPMGGDFEFDTVTGHGIESFNGFWYSEQHSLDEGEQS